LRCHGGSSIGAIAARATVFYAIILSVRQLVEAVNSLTIARAKEICLEGRNAMTRVLTAVAAALTVLCLTLAPTLAQDWPQKQIKFIVPFPAGGGTDFVARLVADHLSRKLNQPVYVENRAGANGAVGLQALKQSDADGYTFGFTPDTPLTVNPWLYKNLSYDPGKDFVPVASAVRLPGMMAANPSLPANTVAELIALAKQKPGGIAYGSAGIGNFSHLAMVLFSQAAGVQMLHVPYKGTAPMAMGILAGEVQVEFNNVSTLYPFVKDGKLKVLGVGETKRMAQFPDWPTVAETVPGFEMAPWVGLIAPAATPKPIVDKMTATMLAVMNDPAVAKQCAGQYLTVMALDQDQFAALIRSDTEKWGNVVKTANIQVEE
jgi:tripartite-type tricarboxylate transporter receptor subunit TctC